MSEVNHNLQESMLMAAANPLPFVGAVMLYHNSTVVNGQTVSPFIVTSLVSDRVVNGLLLPDGGGSLGVLTNIQVNPSADAATTKTNCAFWPTPRFT